MKRTFQNILLAFVSVVLCLSLFEFTVRFFIRPSPICYGVLFGRIELPPFKLTIGKKFLSYDLPMRNIVVDGKIITKGDTMGILDVDPVAGYLPKCKTISRNGWWQSNNLGALSSTDMTQNIPVGKKRVLIFGESFTSCTAIPMQWSWPFLLNNRSNKVEFLNFGVGGYSMGQCLLRFEAIREKADYDLVMLVYVPSADLWREINVLRQLKDWRSFPPEPRFIIKNHQLRLINSPYTTYDAFQWENRDRLSARLKEHLREYDRLYFSTKYESPPFWGSFIFYKLIARAIYTYQFKSLVDNLMDPRSEAMAITLKIFQRMNEEVQQDGKNFVLVILPSSKLNTNQYQQNRVYQQRYDTMVSAIKKEGIKCVDLMHDFLAVDKRQFDKAHDGVHYGPHINEIISDILWRKLNDPAIF